jgi:hypothetical protein
MRKTLFITGLLLIAALLHCQETGPLHSGELYVSANRTFLINGNTPGRFGFGAGYLLVIRPDKTVNVVSGLEFNHTEQFKDYVYNGRFSNYNDVTYKINFVTLPLALRINFGKEKRFFTEPGVFCDFVISSKMEGTQTVYSYDEGNFSSRTYEIKRRANLSSTFGLSFGLGFRMPVKNVVLILRPDIKVSINPLYDYHDTITNHYVRLNIGIQF